MPSNTNVVQFPPRAGATPSQSPSSSLDQARDRPSDALLARLARRPGMKPLGSSLADTLRPYCAAGQRVLWRGEQHWKSDDGTFSTRFDVCTLAELAYAFDYDIVVDCQLAAIVMLKQR